MRNTIIGAAALAAALLVSGQSFAADHGIDLQEREKLQNSFQHSTSFGYPGSTSNYSRPESFTIVRMSQIGDGEAYQVNGKATPANLEALRASIDAATAAELRAHGVQLNNIVGSTTAFNGRTIYYVR